MRTGCPSTSGCPRPRALTALAPEKTAPPSTDPWPAWPCTLANRAQARKEQAAQAIVSMLQSRTTRRASAPLFAPGGQSTQMIVGPMRTDDRTILATSARLYGVHRLRRAYYSAFSPIPTPRALPPLAAPPTVREHRLYQADWLMRFTASPTMRSTPSQVGMLALDITQTGLGAGAPRAFSGEPEHRPARAAAARARLWCADGRPPAGRPPLVRRLRHADLARLHVPLKRCCRLWRRPTTAPAGLWRLPIWLRNWRLRRCNAVCSDTMQRHTVTLDHPTDWPGFLHRRSALVQADVPPAGRGLALPGRCG